MLHFPIVTIIFFIVIEKPSNYTHEKRWWSYDEIDVWTEVLLDRLILIIQYDLDNFNISLFLIINPSSDHPSMDSKKE